jgi:RNA polymerase sigma factor (TIGR02999 family)
VYEELRALARRYLRREQAGVSLQPTDVVHMALLRLERARHLEWQGRTHLLALAAREMRRVLVEHARAAGARKHGGGLQRVELNDELGSDTAGFLDVLAVEEALENLESQSPRRSRVAELRLFGGMTIEEIAVATGANPRTVTEDWKIARAWLGRQLRTPAKRLP